MGLGDAGHPGLPTDRWGHRRAVARRSGRDVPDRPRPAPGRGLAREFVPTAVAHVRNPWRLAGPTLSIWRSPSSRGILDRIRAAGLPVAVLHGDRDLGVPLRTAHDAARRVDGDLVVVHGGRHSWLLKDSEAMPAIMADLLAGRFGDGLGRASSASEGSPTPEALALTLTRPVAGARRFRANPHPVHWTISHPAVPASDTSDSCIGSDGRAAVTAQVVGLGHGAGTPPRGGPTAA